MKSPHGVTEWLEAPHLSLVCEVFLFLMVLPTSSGTVEHAFPLQTWDMENSVSDDQSICISWLGSMVLL